VALLAASHAYGTPPAIDSFDAGPMVGIKAGSTAKSDPQVNLEDLQAATGDSFIGKQAGQSLSNVRPDRTVRGAKEAQLYKRHSRSVVLVITREGLGTGTLVNGSGDILTNWHVVQGYKEVGVVFKPTIEGKEVTKADLVRAKVIKLDEVADLALIHVEKVPAGVEPITLGDMNDLAVGADVHAIGHPTGEAWTYTKGVVSQMRKSYEWSSRETRKAHHANVIQTQTPINPGNSGGPLLTNDGKLVGVNSFKSKGEGLNFAIAVDEVHRFIRTSGNRLAENAKSDDRKTSANDKDKDDGKCKIKEVYSGTNKEDTMEITGIDTDCDGKAEIEIRKPFDIRKPILIVVDDNKDTKPDTILFDTDRDGKWDYSLRDTNFDGKWDLECEHEDGGLEPTRCVPYREKSNR
jgi:S1-C subfamily serine protease